MTALDKYLTQTAAEVAKSDEQAGRSITTTLEQRIACALAEARALESKHLAGEFRMKIANPPEVLIRLANAMDHRANEMIKRSMKMATEPYPPLDTLEPKGLVQ